ncbi:MAG TPA: glutamate synthase subunit alpha, partial [Haloferula sp.]
MNPYYHPSTPLVPGSLHSLSAERDNCGMGAIAHIHGKRSFQVIDMALTSVCNMTHRGAVDADMKTGDGSGILSQIPYPIFMKAAEKLGTKLESESDLAVAVFFLPLNDAAGQKQLKAMAEEVVTKRGITVIGWREAPVNPDALGKIALASRPHIEHLLMKKPAGWDGDHFERQLFLCRRSIERQTKGLNGFYMPTFSSRLISYKGLAMPAALRAFYGDLQDSDFQTAISLYHQRFSTNTFPAWPLGQPFRMMCHNGEINTVEGNRNWMASREEFFSNPIWGDDIALLHDLMNEH